MTENQKTATGDNGVLNLFSILNDPEPFAREDERNDATFYQKERMIDHLDGCALGTIENLIGTVIIEENPVVLDLMASVNSHLPGELATSRISGLGLNEKELAANPRLTERVIHDLNADPRLPFEDESFDVVLNTVSVQYLTKPIKIFSEVARVLKPGGVYIVTFSNRMFEPKAVRIWTLISEQEREELVRDYFESTNLFEKPQTFRSMGQPRPADDKHAATGLPSDPIFAVYADRKGGTRKSPRPRPEAQSACPAPDVVQGRMHTLGFNHECPYCAKKMKLWAVSENPMSTWDHDLYICVNDACPYVVKGWEVMYEQGNPGVSYRLSYDPENGSTKPIPVPNLAVIKNELRD